MTPLEEIISTCRQLAFDLNFSRAKAWKAQDPQRVLVGFTPIYFPREVVHAAKGLAVGILGAGDRKPIIKGDAYYQSYICHMPRGIVELALDGNLDGFDGFVFPSICDVMRNLSGMFQLMGKGRFAKYMDFPQNFRAEIGGAFYKAEMEDVLRRIEAINGVQVTADALDRSIALYDRNRAMLAAIYDIRQDHPWRLAYEDLYCIMRAGLVMPVEEHNAMLEQVLEAIGRERGVPEDRIKVVVAGAFCEQPPLGLIKTIEAAGCYVVDDDFLLGSRWIEGAVGGGNGDPLAAIADAYLTRSVQSSVVYDVGNPKEKRLLDLARRRGADGLVFAAPSFCDPALLDQPLYFHQCEKEGVRYVQFQYNENTGQFKVIKEQVGAFADSIKLWEGEAATA
ncbi:MAG: benzoyl-CoA reductase subunit C [Flavobacteriales bacterium]|nr:benzoyl-CoA reductase subunit C [Flavobacteriales bacterium]